MPRRLRTLVGISVFWLALSMLFDGLTVLVLPVQLSQAGSADPATSLGLVSFAGLLAGMLIQPVAGTLSDRAGARLPLVGAGALLTMAALAFLGMAGGVIPVAAAYVGVLVAANVAQASQQGLIPDLVPPRRRGLASGLKGTMDLGGAFIGFAVLGQLLAGGDVWPALLAIGALIATTYVASVLLVRESRRASAPVQRPRFTDAFRIDLGEHRAFAWLVLSRFLFLLATYAVGRFFLLFVADRLGIAAETAADEAGLLLAGLTLITLLTAAPAGWAADRFGRLPLMIFGATTSAAGAVLLVFAASELHILLFGSLMAIGSAAFAAANWASVADLAPAPEAGRFMALANFGTAGAAALAGLFGPLIDAVDRMAAGSGYPALLVAAAFVFVGSGAVLAGASRAAGVALGRPSRREALTLKEQSA